jgi:hypothetical protein
MPHEGAGEPTPEQLKHVLQGAILRNYPNPERKGCPGSPVVGEIAKQKLPFRDPHWDHVSHCSPCYREFLDSRHKVLHSRVRAKRRTRASLAAIALLVLSGVLYWGIGNRTPRSATPLVVEQPSTPAPPPAPPTPEQPVIASVLNLENESATRSVPQSNTAPADSTLQRLPRKRLALAIYLPLGSQPGAYEVHLLKSESDTQPLVVFRGTAEIENGSTILRVSPDFSAQAAGTHVIGIRHEKDSWRYYLFSFS